MCWPHSASDGTSSTYNALAKHDRYRDSQPNIIALPEPRMTRCDLPAKTIIERVGLAYAANTRPWGVKSYGMKSA